MEEKTPKSSPSLKKALFDRIESEQVCPRSRWVYQGQECAVWFLWFLSIVVGAFAVAVSLFVVNLQQYELYEATHENFFTFVVEVLPYLWIIVFGVMVYVAIYNLRNTKYGYRYPIWVILVSSLVLSFAAGSALQLFGLGYKIDSVIGQHMPMYLSQHKLEHKLWQRPTEGRLVGRQVLTTVAPTSTVIIEDIHGVRWRLDVSELMPREMELLDQEQNVRLLGHSQNIELRLFHACGAFPWMIGPGVTAEDMNKERKFFRERVYNHAKRVKEKVVMVDGEIRLAQPSEDQSVCADLAVVKRMPPPVQER